MIKEFLRPRTIKEALELKAKYKDQAFFLGGGTELNSKYFPFAPEQLISLEGLSLTKIGISATEIVIGACCTIQQLIEEEGIPLPLKTAARHIINRNIRTIATIGGHLGSNKSCGSLLPILVALDAKVEIAAAEKSQIVPIIQYLDAKGAAGSAGLITQLRIPQGTRRTAALKKYTRTANDLSIITVAVTMSRDGDMVKAPIIAIGGVAKHVVRLTGVEDKLNNQVLPAQEKLEKMVSDSVKPISDLRGSVQFKKYLAGVLVASVLEEAYSQKGESK